MFVEKYVKHMSKMTDAPKEYHEIIAYTLLSSTLNQNVKLELKMGMVYPNLWTLLLGESSITRKSTATWLGINRVLPESIDISPQDVTPEGFIDYLSKTPHTLFYRDEFGGFLADMSKKYMAGIKEFMCHLYDCPSTYIRKLRRVSITIEEPYVTLLSSTTISRFIGTITEDDITSGLIPRFLIIIPKNKDKWMGISKKTKGDLYADEQLKKELRGIRKEYNKNPKMDIENTALDKFNDWLKVFELQSMEASDIVKPFYSRLSWYALKFSILNTVQIQSHVITVNEINASIKIVKRYLQSSKRLAELLVDKKTETRIMSVIEKVRDKIKELGTIDRGRLLQMTHTTSKELNEIIYTLRDRGEVRERKIETEGRPRKVYIWKKGGEVKDKDSTGYV